MSFAARGRASGAGQGFERGPTGTRRAVIRLLVTVAVSCGIWLLSEAAAHAADRTSLATAERAVSIVPSDLVSPDAIIARVARDTAGLLPATARPAPRPS